MDGMVQFLKEKKGHYNYLCHPRSDLIYMVNRKGKKPDYFERISKVFTLIGDILEKPINGLDKLVLHLPISQKAKENFSIRKFGILGTISFHLLVLVFFLIINISADKAQKEQGIEIDMKTLEELARLEMEFPQIPAEEDDSRNIAVDQAEDKIESFEDYKNYQASDQVVDNLAKSSVEQTVKDIIDENNLNPNDTELPDIAMEELKMYRAEKTKEEQVYKGATNIFYSLEGREVVNLEVPVYKCEGGGIVKLDIRVNRRGKVEWVSVDTAESETKDKCLIDAAKAAAMKTRFNLNQSAVVLQQGSLTYRFIAQ